MIKILKTEAIDGFDNPAQADDAVMSRTNGLITVNGYEIAMTLIHTSSPYLDNSMQTGIVYYACSPVPNREVNRKVDFSTLSDIENFVIQNAKAKAEVNLELGDILNPRFSDNTKRLLVTRSVCNILFGID